MNTTLNSNKKDQSSNFVEVLIVNAEVAKLNPNEVAHGILRPWP